jgi:hypothetical protein
VTVATGGGHRLTDLPDAVGRAGGRATERRPGGPGQGSSRNGC